MIDRWKAAPTAALAAVLAVGLAGCQSSKTEAKSDPKPEAAKPAAASEPSSQVVELEPAMLKNVTLERARKENLPRVLTATGKIQINEDQTARVLAPLPGQVVDLRPRVG